MKIMETLWKKERFKNLSKRRQAYLIILAFSVFLIPILINISVVSIMTEGFNSPNALMSREYILNFEYYNNSESPVDILIKTEPVENLDDFTRVDIEFGEQDLDFDAHPRRGYIKGTNTIYPIFWIGKKPYESLVGQEIDVMDVLGLFGELDKAYKIAFNKRELYWSDNPEFLGLQIVNQVEVMDGEDIIAEGLIDDDSGLVIYLKGNGIEFILLNSGEFSLTVDVIYNPFLALGLMIAIPLIIFFYSRKKNKEDSINLFLLSLMGTLAIYTDFVYDVWYYTVFTIEFVILIHLGVLIMMFLICYYHRATKFILPSLFEFSFFLLLLFLVGGSYYTSLTLISGSTISFIGLIFYSEKE
jgi:hypothetical protein